MACRINVRPSPPHPFKYGVLMCGVGPRCAQKLLTLRVFKTSLPETTAIHPPTPVSKESLCAWSGTVSPEIFIVRVFKKLLAGTFWPFRPTPISTESFCAGSGPFASKNFDFEGFRKMACPRIFRPPPHPLLRAGSGSLPQKL